MTKSTIFKKLNQTTKENQFLRKIFKDEKMIDIDDDGISNVIWYDIAKGITLTQLENKTVQEKLEHRFDFEISFDRQGSSDGYLNFLKWLRNHDYKPFTKYGDNKLYIFHLKSNREFSIGELYE